MVMLEIKINRRVLAERFFVEISMFLTCLLLVIWNIIIICILYPVDDYKQK